MRLALLINAQLKVSKQAFLVFRLSYIEIGLFNDLKFSFKRRLFDA